MDLQHCYNVSEDISPLPRTFKDLYGPFGFPAPADDRRSYLTCGALSFIGWGVDGIADFVVILLVV